MAQISGKGSKGHHTFRLNVTETSVSVANNTSSLDASFTIDASGWYWEGWGSKITYSLSIAGNSYSGSIPSIPNNKAYTIRSITGISVPHNDDGSKTISYSFSVSDGAGQSYTPGSASASGSLTLTKIDRASSISSITSSVNIGSNCAIGISKKVSSYTSTLEYQIGGTSTWTSIASKWSSGSDLAQTYNWTVPTSVYNSMTSTETQKTITIRLTTYNGDTQIGSSTTSSFTAKATGSPSISSSSVVDTNTVTTNLTQDNTKIVSGVSNIKVTVAAAGINGSTISKITCNGTTMSLTNGTGTLTINSCNVATFAIVVTDSRNATCSATLDKSSLFISYTPLSAVATAIKDQPTSDKAILTAQGDYSATTFATGVVNTLSTTYKYRLAGTSDAYTTGNLTSSVSGLKYSATHTLTKLDYTKDYEVVITVADRIKSIPKTIILKKGVPVFYWDKESIYLNSGNPILDYNKVSDASVSTHVVQLKDKNGNPILVNPYPVDSIYISTSPTSPSLIYGGTWEKIGTDRVLMGASADSKLKQTVDAGLPGITGSMSSMSWNKPVGFYNMGTSGAMYNVNTYPEGRVTCEDTYWGAGSGSASLFGIDASRSSAIYGKSTTVQPAAYYVYFWRRKS